MIIAAGDLDPAWIGLGGVAVGSVISGFVNWLSLKHQAAGAEQQRKHDRTVAIEDREAVAQAARESYQVETLLELQLAIQRSLRAAYAIHYSDVMRQRSYPDVEFGRHPTDDGLSIEAMESAAVLRLLSARVVSEDVRDALDHLHHAITEAANARSEGEGEAILTAASDAAVNVNGLIAAQLRTLPPPSQYRPLVTSPFLEFDRRRLESE